jgi:hypothetical protein
MGAENSLRLVSVIYHKQQHFFRAACVLANTALDFGA